MADKESKQNPLKTFVFLKDIQDGRFKFAKHQTIQENINEDDLLLSPSDIIDNKKEFSMQKQFILLQIIKKACKEVKEDKKDNK